MIGPGYDPWRTAISGERVLNSPNEILRREGVRGEVLVHVTGNNDSYNLNIFKLFGTVDFISNFIIITEINNMSNLTNVYSDLWDGAFSDSITADGADLSGIPVGSWFAKDRESTEAFSVVSAATAKAHEIRPADDIGLPFQITQKTGDVDTFIRFNYTTNTVLDFYGHLFYKWRPVNGGYLELAV
jgi:hypothetical protein